MVGSVKFSATESGSEYLNIRILYYIWKEINLKKKTYFTQSLLLLPLYLSFHSDPS